MCISILTACMNTQCMPRACRGQKKAVDLVELELWMVVSCHVGAEIRTQVLCKDSKRF